MERPAQYDQINRNLLIYNNFLVLLDNNYHFVPDILTPNGDLFLLSISESSYNPTITKNKCDQ